MPRQKDLPNHLERKVRSTLAKIFRAHPDRDLTKVQIVDLAKKSRGLPPEWIEGLREKALAKEIGRILRSEKFATEHGEELRLYHCYKAFIQVDGKEVQKTFWRDIHTMNHRQMAACLRSRYALAENIRQQAKATQEYWNQNVAPKLGEKRIQKRLFE